MDRGMASEDNVEFLQQEGRRYILGTPKSMLKRFERDLLSQDWKQVQEGLEVRLCAAPQGEEVFILCRSAERREKERAIHERFEKRIEEGLKKIQAGCGKRKASPTQVAQRVGGLLGENSRAAKLLEVNVEAGSDGGQLQWKKLESWREWARISEGCYLLRSNVTDWSGEELWRAYIQLTEAEAAFRVHKSDLQLRPIWHQTEKRVQAHILAAFGLTCYGRHWLRCASMLAWAMILAPCSRNYGRSSSSKSFCRPEPEWRSENAASLVPPSHKRSCFNDSGCSCRRAWKWLSCSEDFGISTLQIKDLLL
jgi:transposase